MSGGEENEFDLKSFVTTVNQQFQALNMRLDSFQPPSPAGSRKHPSSEEEEYSDRSNEKRRRVESRRDSHVGSIKMTIPSFKGKNDPELYLEWERKIEHVFDCHNYSEEKKIKLAVVEFTDYGGINL
ncbi:hypothetical protein QL285_003195 [Trifolium repens]|nr:hypothetical protein QL285_003195 [Trifolium repens]